MTGNLKQPKASLTANELQQLCANAYYVRQYFESMLLYVGYISDLVHKIPPCVEHISLVKAQRRGIPMIALISLVSNKR